MLEDVEAAGRLALDSRDRVCGTDWASKGLPATLSLRIALHGGPIYWISPGGVIGSMG